MALRNISLRRLKMFNVIRSVCGPQSGSGRGLAGVLSVRINSCPILEYGTHAKGGSVEPNSKANLEDAAVGNKPSKRNAVSPKITLISTNLSPTVVTLEEAQKISKRRDLKLVKVVDDDHKSHRPVYKLMTGTEYFQEDLNRRKEKSAKRNSETKDPKLLTLTAKISDHDLRSKIKNILKWLDRKHEVRIVINAGDNFEAAERICETIETEAKTHGKMVQKRTKGTDLKFQLVPLKKSSDDDVKSSKESAPDTTTAES